MSTPFTGRMSAVAPPIQQLQLPLDLPPTLVYPPAAYVADTGGRARPMQIPAAPKGTEGVS